MKPWSFIITLYQKGNQWNSANQAKHRRERPRSLSSPRTSQQFSSGIAEEFFDLFQRKKHQCERCILCFSLHKLRNTVKEKRREMLSCGVCLLQDNAPVHTAAVAKAAVKECGFQEIEHPPYSPDLALSDYYLFSKLKKNLWVKKFDDEEVKTPVMQHFTDKEPEFFFKGIELLVQRCEKCFEIKGDYIEKWQSCFISVTLKSWSGRKLLDPSPMFLYSYILFR